MSTFWDDIKMPCVDESVKLYFRISWRNKDIISLVAHEHSVVVSMRTNDRFSPSTGFEEPEELNISTLFLKCMIKIKKSSSPCFPSSFSSGLVICFYDKSFARIIILDSFNLFFSICQKMWVKTCQGEKTHLKFFGFFCQFFSFSSRRITYSID